MEYGICNLGIIPARREASDKAEIITQIVFGEHFKILEEVTNANGAIWLKILTHHDNYEAWICGKQYKEITGEDYDNLSLNDFPKNATTLASLTSEKGELIPIPIGSTLPYLHQKKLRIRNTTYSYTGEIASKNFDDIIKYAKQLEGTPYLWGGRGPLGIDCSGFAQLCYNLCGIQLPRDAYQQADEGEVVSFLEEVLPGDLAFFDNDEGRINHVGILLNQHEIIHASGKIRIDKIDHQGIYAEDYKKYTHKLRIIKRIV